MQIDGPESMHGYEALMPGFTGAGEFELIVPFQDQITHLVTHRSQTSEHQSLIQ